MKLSIVRYIAIMENNNNTLYKSEINPQMQ